MATEAQRRAKSKYRKEKAKQVVVRFFPPDYELYEWLKSQDNMNGYIKDLIRKDMH